MFVLAICSTLSFRAHLSSAVFLCALGFFQYIYMLKQIGADETLKFQRGFVVSAEREQVLKVCSGNGGQYS